MINWIKKVLGIAQPEPKQPAQEVPHFHVDRFPHVRPFDEEETKASMLRTIANTDFESMNKLEIDIWARNNLGINLDRRRTKDYMIKQIKSHLKKEN